MRKQEIKRKNISNWTSNNKATSYRTLLFWQRSGLDNYSFRSDARYIYGNVHFSGAALTVGSKWTRAPPHRPLPSRSVDRGQFTFSSCPSLLVCREQNGGFADLISWGSPDCSSLCWITAILHNVFKLGPGKQRECHEPLNTLSRDYLFSAEGINNGAKGGLVQWYSFYLLENKACNPPQIL